MMKDVVDDWGDAWAVYCPACRQEHVFAKGRWEFDGNMKQPTFSPSILVRWSNSNRTGWRRICHSFLRAGMWDYLGDSTHQLAGQQVPALPDPDKEPTE